VGAGELLRRMRRYRGVFRASKGGITLSGGEVLMQPAFAARLLEGAKKMGIHTCLDTSGFLGANATDAMLDNVDLVLLDVKSGDEETYKKVTGRSLAPTIAFGDRLAAKGIEIWARFVLVPGLTDDPANVENVARIIERWRPVVSRVEVLPFHQMGTDKWDTLGLDDDYLGRLRREADTRALLVICHALTRMRILRRTKERLTVTEAAGAPGAAGYLHVLFGQSGAEATAHAGSGHEGEIATHDVFRQMLPPSAFLSNSSR